VTLNCVSYSQNRRNTVASLRYSPHPLSVAWYRSCCPSKRLGKIKQREEVLDYRERFSSLSKSYFSDFCYFELGLKRYGHV